MTVVCVIRDLGRTSLPRPSGPRLNVSGGCRRWLRLCRGNPRTRSPLSRLRHLGCFIHIGLRSGATGPPRFGGSLDLLLDICRSRLRLRRCRGHCCHGFSTQAKLLRQSGALLGIGKGRKRMIAPQPPPPPIFISVQAVTDADVTAEHLAPVAAIQADHIILADGLPHRYRRSQRHLGRIGSSSLS